MLYLRLLVAALFASVRASRDLVLENLALRHQLAVYTRGRRRPRLRRHDRRFWSLLARGWSGWRGTLVMVEPDTVVRVASFCLARLLALEESSRNLGVPTFPPSGSG